MTSNLKTIEDYKEHLLKRLNEAYDGEAETLNEVDDILYTLESGDPKIPELIGIEQNGGEGQGDDWSVVFKYMDKTFRVAGYYASYDGTDVDADDWEEVKPVERMVTFYEAV